MPSGRLSVNSCFKRILCWLVLLCLQKALFDVIDSVAFATMELLEVAKVLLFQNMVTLIVSM